MIAKTKLNFKALFFVGLFACFNAAAQTPAVTSVLSASLVTVVDGKTVKKPAADAKPGDVIEYVATYTNNSKAPIERLLASIPVPEGTTLVDKTAAPADATASVDAVTFMPMPLMRSVKSASGAPRSESVPLGEYRAVRWSLATVSAGQQAAVSVRVRVNPTVAPAALATTATVKP